MWPHLLATFVGVWLMAAPAVLGYEGSTAADMDRIFGPIIATFACTAIFEATRSVRWWNMPICLWLLIAPFVLHYDSKAAIINSICSALAVAALSVIRGRIAGTYGGGWTVLFSSAEQNQRSSEVQPDAT